MTSKRKFYQTTYHIELLTEEPMSDGVSLQDIAYEMTDGHASGVFDQEDVTELDGPAAAAALQAQGSDPEFFRLTEDGEDIDEESQP